MPTRERLVYARVGANLELSFHERLDPSYCNYAWPAAVGLCEVLYHEHGMIRGKNIVEQLGAGVGLCGLLCSRLGANQVVLSDIDLSHLERIASENQNVSARYLDWSEGVPDDLKGNQVDLITGSDLFYDSNQFEDIIATVSMLSSHQTEFWTVHHERNSKDSIQFLLDLYGLHVTAHWGISTMVQARGRFITIHEMDGAERPLSLSSLHFLRISQLGQSLA